MKWLENQEVLGSNPNTDNISDFYSYVLALALMVKLTYYMLLVESGKASKYPISTPNKKKNYLSILSKMKI